MLQYSVSDSLLAVLGLTVGWGLLLAAYRLLLHPLARAGIPGPKLAAATYWYSFYQDIIAGPYPGLEVYNFKELHDQYGPVVRVNPDEVHVRDAEWFDTLYGSGRRDKWLRNIKANGSPGSVAQTGSADHHRARRAPLNQFFSRRAVINLEHSIKAKVDLLTSRIATEWCSRELEVGVGFTALTMDVITEYSFGQSWKCLAMPGFSPEWKRTMTGGFYPVPMVKQMPWILKSLLALPRWVAASMSSDMTRMIDAKRHVLTQVERIIAEREEGKLSMGSSDEHQPNTIFEKILDSNLPADEKAAWRLTDEGFVIVVAGAETTAKTLTNAVFYLLDDEKWLSKVLKELDKAMPDPAQLPSWSELEQLPYFSASIKETLRLSNPVTNRLQLIDPNDLACGSCNIPQGTPVSMSVMDIHHNPEIFEDPMHFDPGRWIGEEGKKLNRFYAPFQKGTRACLGANLAYAEIYLALAAMLRRLEMRLPEDAGRVQVDSVRDCFVGMPPPNTPALQVKILRKRS